MKDLDVRLKMINVLRTVVQSGWVLPSEMEPFACLVLENMIEDGKQENSYLSLIIPLLFSEDEECKTYLLNLLSDFYPCLTCETGFYRKVIQEIRKVIF